MPTKPRPKVATTTSASPLYVLERDGITFSLLSTFRDCRWKTRHYVMGLTKMNVGFPIIFGNVVHAALERCYRAQRDNKIGTTVPPRFLMQVLTNLEETFRAEHPRMDPETANALELTMLMCEQLMPRYFHHWAERDAEYTWLQTEKEFRLPETVHLRPVAVKGKWRERKVDTFLRGKIDGVYQRAKALGLLETKTRGRVEPGNIMSMLPYMLQPSIYLIAAERAYDMVAQSVTYNIVRRPQLQQRKSENIPQFATRIGEDIDARPDWYFMRINMDLERNDIARMRDNLDDLLRDFVEWWVGEGGHYPNDGHCENKYGQCEFLDWCGNGNKLLYYRRDRMFSELEEV